MYRKTNGDREKDKSWDRRIKSEVLENDFINGIGGLTSVDGCEGKS